MAKGLLDLPFEILAQICRSWCSHCITLKASSHSAGEERSFNPESWETTPTATAWGVADLGHAGDRGGQTTLVRLSRTCRYLRAVAQPILYHDFVRREHPALFNFVRTLLRRPDLGQQVQRLSISISGPGWIYDEDDVTRFQNHARHLGLSLSPQTSALLSRTCVWPETEASSPRDTWSASAALDSAVLKDLLSLLLPLVPHVKEAYLQLISSPQQPQTHADTSEQAVFRLPDLRKLSFGPRSAATPTWFSQPDILPVLVCPRLTVLHLRFCTDPPRFDHGSNFAAPYGGDAGFAPALSASLRHITVLRITGCRVSRTFLDNMLAQIGPHLTTFTLVLGYLWNIQSEGYLPDDVTPREVIEGLLPWAETLRAVRIDLSKAVPRAVKLRKADLIDSFHHFRHLGVLELDLSCVYIAQLDGLLMFGVDTAQADWDMLVNLLPDSIREFVLNGPTHRVYDALEELSDRAAAGSFKDLVDVRCDDGPVAHLEHLRDRFGIAGVSFSLRIPKYGFRHTLSGLF